ncbi:MAG: response regulator [Nitrospirae bacterium]|nr:response regulator [Nitrospirota bacterium]
MAKKLLVVDSNLAIQKLVEYNLSRETFEVTYLNDGLSALDLLTQIDPDLILADYHLEGISFIRFCEKVKQKQSAKERPILVLVSATDSYDPNKLLSLGVVDFVKKPLEPRELIEKLKDLSQGTATVIDKAPRPPVSAAVETPAAPPLQPTAKEQAEIMKIEELLGWSLPGEKPSEEATQKSEDRRTEQDNEMTMVQSRADFVVPPPVRPEPPKETPAPPVADPMPGPDESEQTVIGLRIPPPPAAAQPPPPPPVAEASSTPPTEAPSAPITPAMLEEAFPHLYAGPETVEIPPSPAPSAQAPSGPSAAVSQEMVEAVVSKIAKEIIEKVAWEVVPSLAEILIKEELEKLKTEKPS